MLERIVVDEAMEGLFQCTRHLGRSTGAWTLPQTLRALVGKAMHPLAQGGRGQLQRVRDGLEALAFDDVAYGLGTAEDADLLRLFQEGVESGQGIIGKVPFEGPHKGGLQNKVLQKYAHPMSHHVLTLLSAHSFSDSNFPEAA
jgi:hypothetical protein